MAFPTTILSHLRLQNWLHTVAYQDAFAILPASRKHHNFITIITCLFDVSWPLMASLHLIGVLCQVCCRLEGSQASCRDSFALVELGAKPQEQLFHQLAMLSELVQAWTTHSPRKAMDAASTVPVLGTQTILATFGSAGTPRMFFLKVWIHKFILLYPLEFQCSSTFFTSQMHPNAESIKKNRENMCGQKPGRPRSQMAGPVFLAISSFNSWIGIDSQTATSVSSCNKSCRSRPASTSCAKAS